MEAIRSSETYFLTGATRRHIPEEVILHVSCEGLGSLVISIYHVFGCFGGRMVCRWSMSDIAICVPLWPSAAKETFRHPKVFLISATFCPVPSDTLLPSVMGAHCWHSCRNLHGREEGNKSCLLRWMKSQHARGTIRHLQSRAAMGNEHTTVPSHKSPFIYHSKEMRRKYVTPTELVIIHCNTRCVHLLWSTVLLQYQGLPSSEPYVTFLWPHS
jgi:hypothetical protein